MIFFELLNLKQQFIYSNQSVSYTKIGNGQGKQ